MRSLPFVSRAVGLAAAILCCVGGLADDERAQSVRNQSFQKAVEERYRKLQARLDQLELSFAELRRKHDALQKENKDLRQALDQALDTLEGREDFASREEVAALKNAIQEVDRNRRKDHENAIKQLDGLKRDLLKAIRAAAPAPVPKPPAPAFDRFRIHEVENGQTLSSILKAYNDFYEREGLRRISQADVIAANPDLKPNRIVIGQKIKIPEPNR